MKLYINTSDSTKVVVGLGEEKVERDARVQKSQMLLSIINEELEKRGKKINDVKEVEVFLGPGSFTGLRVGVTVANALGWSLQIPVNGKKQLVEPVYQ